MTDCDVPVGGQFRVKFGGEVEVEEGGRVQGHIRANGETILSASAHTEAG